MTNDSDAYTWRGRFEAIGRAQARYLWIVLIVSAFYLALQSAPIQTVTIPVLHLGLNSNIVLAVGGPVLSLLLIALAGSLSEWGHTAEKAFGPDWRDVIERYDLCPTVLDLAHYTVRQQSKALDIAAYLLFYPVFLAMALVEAASLLVRLATNAAPARGLLLVVGASLWLWAAWLIVGDVCWKRLRRVPAMWRERSSPTD